MMGRRIWIGAEKGKMYWKWAEGLQSVGGGCGFFWGKLILLIFESTLGSAGGLKPEMGELRRNRGWGEEEGWLIKKR